MNVLHIYNATIQWSISVLSLHYRLCISMQNNPSFVQRAFRILNCELFNCPPLLQVVLYMVLVKTLVICLIRSMLIIMIKSFAMKSILQKFTSDFNAIQESDLCILELIVSHNFYFTPWIFLMAGIYFWVTHIVLHIIR